MNFIGRRKRCKRLTTGDNLRRTHIACRSLLLILRSWLKERPVFDLWSRSGGEEKWFCKPIFDETAPPPSLVRDVSAFASIRSFMEDKHCLTLDSLRNSISSWVHCRVLWVEKCPKFPPMSACDTFLPHQHIRCTGVHGIWGKYNSEYNPGRSGKWFI